MPWRYGIIRFRHSKDPEFRYYGVGELFYDNDPLAPYACSQEPDTPYSELEEFNDDKEASESILWALEAMANDCRKYPIFDVDGPFSKAPWDGKKSLDSLTFEQLDSMTDEEIEKHLESDEE